MKLDYDIVKVEELKPGDLFVNSSKEEMDTLIENEMGVAIFIRTNAPLSEKIPVEKFAKVLKLKIKQ